MDLSNLKQVLQDEPKFRYEQVYTAVYRQFISSWDEAGNISKKLREELKENCPLEIKAELSSSGGKKTIKAGIYFKNGDMVESVLMRYSGGRNTVCVSTQVGCSMGCKFCATGRAGFKRNLSYTEIVQQVLFFERYLKEKEQKVTNVVFMGMGEPMLNYEQVMRAIKFLNDKDFFNIGSRKISVSTVGIPECIKKLYKENIQVNLAVSLNAASDTLRNSIMPINKRYDIKRLLKAVSAYIDATGRKVMIEYVMLADVNDSQAQANKLADLLKKELGKNFMVNLIEFNPTLGYIGSSAGRIERFKDILEKKGIKTVQRYKFGRDIKAACGQLAGERKGPAK
ncbi:MAG: 23S rRNA (adenine(2503)-C(2))-methyltransferase RlmN [Patescibacteria group bacterium]